MPRVGDLNPAARVDDTRAPGRRALNYEDPTGSIVAGQQIGSLFAGIPILDQFGQLIPAPLTNFVLSLIDDVPFIGDFLSIILGTDGGGLDPTTLLTGFFDGLRTFLPFLPDLGSGSTNPVAAAADFITGILNPANILTFFSSGLIPGLDASKITSGSFADGIVPGVLSLMNGLFGGLTGWASGGSGDNANQADVGEAINAQTVTLANISAQVAKMQAAITSTDPSIIVVEEPFEYVNALGADPALWDIEDRGPGTVGHPIVDGHQLSWDTGGGTQDRDYIMRYIGGANAECTGDLIGVKIVLGDTISTQASFPAAHDLLLRMNSTRTRYVRLRVLPKSWELASFNAGVKTPIASQSLSTQPGAGSIISCDAGTLAVPAARVFAIKVNGTTWTITESGTASPVGAGFRWRGLGVHAGQRIFFGASQQLKPGPVAHWASENNPAA